MGVNLDTRCIESPAATEIYISAAPGEDASPTRQAAEIFSGITDVLHSKKAYILQERVFAVQSAMDIVSRVRSEAYGDSDDGVAPAFLLCSKGMSGPIAGVQIHAVIADGKPEVIDLDGTLCGRILHLPGRTYLTLSQISAPGFEQPTEQAGAMLEKAESALKQFGTDFLSVPRTWIWLGDILSWYGDFNRVRNEFFTQRGAIGRPNHQSMPASTGIGLTPAGGAKCAMDLIAVLEPSDSIHNLPAVGRQHCALEYGSAFSRASRAITPAGETVFVSGTASIDATGATTNIGDAAGQINATVENVRAVLKDTHCADKDVVQMVAYCKTAEVGKIFNDFSSNLPWPGLAVICDICRPDLLFEIEAAAMPRS